MRTVGPGAARMVTVALLVTFVVPLVHVMVYVDVASGDTLCEPEVPVKAVQGALHEVTLLPVQLRVDEPPAVMLDGVAVRDTLGVPVTVTVALLVAWLVPSVHVTV